MFRRYDVVEQADLADAAARLDAKQISQSSLESQFGQTLGRNPETSTNIDATTAKGVTMAVLAN